MTVERVVTSAGDHTSHYKGAGYQYFFSHDKAHGRICKMQVSKQMLDDFANGVGRINGINLPHLQALDQGNGWWLFCSDQPQFDNVVTQFVARFNRWALKKAGQHPEPTRAPEKTRYVVEVRENHHGRLHRPGQRLSSAQPVVASEGSLQELAESINARFGHTRRK